MKRTLMFSLLLLCFGFLQACGDSPESLAVDCNDTMGELGEVLGDVKDKESAEDAKDKIKGIKDDLKDLFDRAKELTKDMSEEEKKEFNKTMNELTKEGGDKMSAAMKNVSSNMAIVPVLMDLLKDMPKPDWK